MTEAAAQYWEKYARLEAHFRRGLEIRMEKTILLLEALPESKEVTKAIKTLKGSKL